MVIQDSSTIQVAKARDSVRVQFPDGLILEGAVGATVEEFLLKAQDLDPLRYDSTIMGGVVDGKLRELAFPIKRDADLKPVLLSSSDGGRIYRRSLVMLMTVAAQELWPDIRVSVRYAVPDGGFYCKLLNRDPFTQAELDQLDAHMREIVAVDDPISKRMAPLEAASALFQSRHEDDKVRLLEQRTRRDLTLYTLRGRDDYYYGYMLPSTGYMQIFRLHSVDGGFILQYPRKEHPSELQKLMPYQKLGAVFLQADIWLEKLDIEDIGRLNREVREGRVNELILVAEALHEHNVANIAEQISEQHLRKGVRVVLIAGPSSSGKTTFSKRLAIQLLANGLRPFTVELDNYFVNRELTPRDENNEFDFEALGAINLSLFNDHLLQLMAGERIQLPKFDFQAGRSKPDKGVQIAPHQIIIIEGIHGLNPDLVPAIPPESIFRVYISALTQLNVDDHNRVPTTDVRLLRRIVRDANYRGYTATDTLTRWQSVRRGEKRNIFPFQENADAMFNSALVYELAALSPFVEPLLLQVEVGTPSHIEANRLLSFLRWVKPLTEEQRAMIPDTSLLREFIGGSILRDYHPGTGTA